MPRPLRALPWFVVLVGFAALALAGYFAHRSLRPLHQEAQPASTYLWIQLVVAGIGVAILGGIWFGWRSGDRAGLWSAIGGALTLGFGLLLWHWWLWSNYTMWIDAARFRIFRSHSYQPTVVERWEFERQNGLPKSSVDDLIQKARYKTDEIFLENSRESLPPLLFGSWVAACGALVAGAALLCKISEEDVEVERVRTLVLSLQPRLPAHFFNDFLGTIDTLSSARNVKGTITSVAGLFSGPHGLLLHAVERQRSEIATRMALWNDKETKNLRNKYEKQGFGKLDFVEQIEVVRLTGVIDETLGADLTWIRQYANTARHNNRAVISPGDGIIALERAAKIACWYCKVMPPQWLNSVPPDEMPVGG